MKKHIFVIGFVFLLLFSSVAPLSTAYNVKKSNIKKNTIPEILHDLFIFGILFLTC